MPLAANLANMQITLKMTETLPHGYSSENTQQGLFKEYEHDKV